MRAVVFCLVGGWGERGQASGPYYFTHHHHTHPLGKALLTLLTTIVHDRSRSPMASGKGRGPPKLRLYTPVLQRLWGEGQAEAARRVWEEMEARGAVPNEEHVVSMVRPRRCVQGWVGGVRGACRLRRCVRAWVRGACSTEREVRSSCMYI